MSSRCWAIHPTYGRCGEDGGHDGLHSVAFSWGDDECVTPDQAIHVVTTTGGNDVPIVRVSSAPTMESTGRCFGCGCSEAAHAGGGCAKHQCKHFVP